MSGSGHTGWWGTGPRFRGAPAANRRRRGFLKRGQKGLTLVELMIVVTIIAIIAAVAIAVYQDIVKKSKLAADQGVVSSLRSAVAIYYGRSNGLFPATFGAVESLVQPAPVYNCTVPPTYDKNNGRISFSATIADCP
ncbi:MAG TPA: prepilin-type N-terminal cleavage/methylation domain-containing protein [Methylomirabilota bacterium]|jgi:prepilin-type N-terminal cleavage/methylation domain-containing protein